MNGNEMYEANLSALLDGELEGEELRETLDALAMDESLQRFWRDARTLQSRLAGAETRETPAPLPEELWNAIEQKSDFHRPRVIRLRSIPARAWAAAAIILLAVGLYAGGLLNFIFPVEEAQAKTVELASKEGHMTEERFLALTTEILQADPRYHRKMLEVMQAVNRQAYGERLTATKKNEPSGEDVQPEDRPPLQNDQRPSTDMPSSSQIDFNLW